MRNLIIFLLFFFLLACNDIVEENSQQTDNVNNVGVVVKIRTIDILSEFEEQVLSNGKISAIEKSNLQFKMSERILRINVSNGQKVNKGNIVAVIENDLLKNNVDKAEIELKKAQNKFREEKINYGSSNLTKELVERLKIKSNLLEANNNLEKYQIEYEQTILKAPFSGVIANLEKRQGDFITSSDVFCTIINPNTLEVSFSVLENEFDFISKGQKIEIQSFTDKDKQFKGVITEINPIVDKNGLIKIKAKVTSKNTGLLDGINVKVFINKPLEGVIVIPKEALVLRTNRVVVFTYENGLAKWNYVELAGENSTSYAIKKGLKISDTLIVSGNLNISHDAKVNATFVVDDTVKK